MTKQELKEKLEAIEKKKEALTVGPLLTEESYKKYKKILIF